MKTDFRFTHRTAISATDSYNENCHPKDPIDFRSDLARAGGDFLNELSLDGFRHSIRQTYGSESRFLSRERVHEQFDGDPAWEGEVLVFQLLNHPTATHCYAWEQDGRVTAVLHAGHINGAVNAVRASILGELDNLRKHE